MTDPEAQAMRRENAYLKQRCAQLETDVVDLESQVARLQQAHEHMTSRRVSARPNPLAGGQG